MAHVITQNCCNDAACVVVCPVNCIHPTPDEPDFKTAEMLYIDPDVCIDCGACLDTCPVSAIYPDYELPEKFAEYEQLNAAFFADPVRATYEHEPLRPAPQAPPMSVTETEPLRVAVVGSGPAAFYAAQEILSRRGMVTEVDMFERLPVPGGLVRYGVAPDHQSTKGVLDNFARTMRRKGFRFFGNVEVGRDITHEQLTERYHAVVYALGAMSDHALGLRGEDLPNSESATAFVGWYNGHPDFADESFDLSCDRAVVIGNGNVAVDVARILCSDWEALARTDISEPALVALQESKIKEVVIVGRRGPLEAAFTFPELLGLSQVPGIEVAAPLDELDLRYDHAVETAGESFSTGGLKNDLLRRLTQQMAKSDRKITFRFLRTPVEILGDTQVRGVRLVRNDLVREGDRVVARPTGDLEDLRCGLVLRAVGYRGAPVLGLPFDQHRSVLPHVEGRVVDPDTGKPIPGTYVAGWLKRGPSGVIGTNKKCARETVTSLLSDFAAGRLAAPVVNDDVATLVTHAVDAQGWRAIDAYERTAGRNLGRPRQKLLEVSRMLEVSRGVS
ncbi:FAD-dependent oxidoreductase [Rhodococcus aetherivorans]